MVAPEVGADVKIKSYKHNGSLHRVWDSSIILKGNEKVIIGANDKTIVTEGNGRSWITREPAICYFHAEHWFNIIGMLRNDGIHYYCNISSPFVFENNSIKYIDYDLDLKVFPDMTYNVLDEDEYEEHKIQMNYPKELDEILYRSIDQLIYMVHQRKGPFSPGYIDQWYERFLSFHW